MTASEAGKRILHPPMAAMANFGMARKPATR